MHFNLELKSICSFYMIFSIVNALYNTYQQVLFSSVSPLCIHTKSFPKDHKSQSNKKTETKPDERKNKELREKKRKGLFAVETTEPSCGSDLNYGKPSKCTRSPVVEKVFTLHYSRQKNVRIVFFHSLHCNFSIVRVQEQFIVNLLQLFDETVEQQ